MHNEDIHCGHNVTVIGAGASGLMAAVSAARAGASVIVLDHMPEAGRKLALTGNGKCNYTNTGVSPEHYHCRDRLFAETVLEAFPFEDCVSFFRELGIRPKIRHYPYDDLGYVYPDGIDAAGFRDRLLKEARDLGVRFEMGLDDGEVLSRARKYAGLLPPGKDTPGKETSGKDPAGKTALIIAAGSNAMPSTGSDSSVYPLLKELGLKFNSFLPALCALYSRDPVLKERKGKRVRGKAELRIYDEAVREYSCSGEIQFNEHSISGIPVMQLSRHASPALKAGLKAVLTADGHDFEIYRAAGFDRAQCCSGGVDLAEIDPHTMECVRVPGVFVCGELLDIDGECGGFNLHMAWATGMLAGRNAAASVL